MPDSMKDHPTLLRPRMVELATRGKEGGLSRAEVHELCQIILRIDKEASTGGPLFPAWEVGPDWYRPVDRGIVGEGQRGARFTDAQLAAAERFSATFPNWVVWLWDDELKKWTEVHMGTKDECIAFEQEHNKKTKDRPQMPWPWFVATRMDQQPVAVVPTSDRQ